MQVGRKRQTRPCVRKRKLAVKVLKKRLRILEDWKVTYVEYSNVAERATRICQSDRWAEICGPHGKRTARDFVLHEMLHVALAAFRDEKLAGPYRNLVEEYLVCDICEIWRQAQGLKPRTGEAYASRR